MGTKIFFDWDDTLMYTTALLNNDTLLDKEIFATNVYKLLELSLTMGEVYIVTNATIGWFNICIEEHMTILKPLLDNITIASARDHSEYLYPDDPLMWKINTFNRICYNSPTKNIISFGDSYIEYNAIYCVAILIDDCLCKNYKLIEMPSIEILNLQIVFIIENLSNIINNNINENRIITV